MPSSPKLLDGTITGWNRAAERLFGFTAAETVGKNIDMIVPPERRAEVSDIVERIRRGEPIEQYETLRVHKDGRSIDVSLSISPIRVGRGRNRRHLEGRARYHRNQADADRRSTRKSRSGGAFSRPRNDLILVTDTAGNFIQVSPSVTAILGYSRPT